MARQAKANWPVVVAFVVSGAFLLWRLSTLGWDAIALAELGSMYSEGQAQGTQGYDGQFAYYIAVDPNPSRVAQRLDVPAYRYQRILYPILARLLAGGSDSLVPWTLVAINLLSNALGTWALVQLLLGRGMWPGYALIYGLWVGLVSGVGLQLYEPLAFGLIAAGWLARSRGRKILGAVLLGASLFVKETCLFFWAAALAADFLGRKDWRSVGFLAGGGVLYLAWQVCVWRIFGSPGLVSGGTMATPFEWIPFMGLWRVGQVSMAVLAMYLVIFGPTILLPTLWGLGRSLQKLWRDRDGAENWALLLNSLFIIFLPFSTFREPLGLLRVATGLVLAVILFAAVQGMRKPLNYGLFWIPLLVVLVNR